MRAATVTALMGLFVMTASATAPIDPRGGGSPQQAIVVFHDSVSNPAETAAQLVSAHGGQLGFVYRHALKGFSATLPVRALTALERDPRVAYVELDQQVSIVAQTVPTGIERIFADDNANIDIDSTDDWRVDVDVAVIDTGIDFEHSDLNVVGGVECSGSPLMASCSDGGDDDHFHGTHVAGTIGALDNDFGVVGVAPGARLWAVKVLDSGGSGWNSEVIAGIDWVTDNASTIEVANMSLGGGDSPATCDAIANSVAAGVAYAVAAGNSDDDANNYSPANCDTVLTISALADFDGDPGGLGAPTCREDQDDTLADFSNWGDAVELAAPGVCILSTYPIEEGEYGTISGTSMASPHAAGALALLASADNPSNGADVGVLYDTVVNNGNFDWTDDSGDGIQEPLLDVGDSSVFAPLLVAGSGDGGGDTNSPPSASFTFSCTDLACDFDGSGSSDSDGTIASYDWDFGDGNTGSGATVSHTYAVGGTYTVTLTVTDDGGATDSESQDVTVSDGTNAAPTASFTFACTDLACDFDGSDSSDSDGSISSYDWDFGDGNSGSGATVSHTYGAGGTYTVTLTVTDDDGATDSESQDVTVSEPATGDFTLTATGYKFRGLQKADLEWSGATSTNVDVYRDGVLIATTENDGFFTDNIDLRGPGTYTYVVCEAGSTEVCSNEATVNFS